MKLRTNDAMKTKVWRGQKNKYNRYEVHGRLSAHYH